MVGESSGDLPRLTGPIHPGNWIPRYCAEWGEEGPDFKRAFMRKECRRNRLVSTQTPIFGAGDGFLPQPLRPEPERSFILSYPRILLVGGAKGLRAFSHIPP